MKSVALVTGASSGIGKEKAKLLLQKGYIVYGASRRVEKMNDLKEAGIKLLEMDVTEDDSMVAGVNEILRNENRIDILVNNAGYGSFGALEDVPISEARYQFEVNIFGLARLIQLVLPTMRQQHSGRIINVSSIGGSLGEPHGSWYHATKFADKRGSLPVVVARTIVKAASAKRPKTRYATGGGAKIILFIRSLLSDRMFDRLFLSMLR
jgi:NADP-dependent 3-hydroxy acid dehydrogenase YdfG